MAEHEPLNLQPLIDAYPTAEGKLDRVLGQITWIDFGNQIFVCFFACFFRTLALKRSGKLEHKPLVCCRINR